MSRKLEKRVDELNCRCLKILLETGLSAYEQNYRKSLKNSRADLETTVGANIDNI